MIPKIGITIGDPAGIGPEIIVKLLKAENVDEICAPIVIGSELPIKDITNILGYDLIVYKIKDPSEYRREKGVINLIDLKNIKDKKIKYAQIVPEYGKAAGEYIAKGIELAFNKKIDALVTCPIHKESFKLGGYGQRYAGHTEMLADMTKAKKYSMMLAHGNLRVVHVSTHVSLKEALKLVKKRRILDVIRIAHNACLSLGIKYPKIGVTGLNPHSGEGGLFGMEEIEEIIPAIISAKKEGMNVEGPVPPDSAFAKSLGGIFDIVVTMYHDQGHIPIKTVGFHWDSSSNSWGKMSGVNITLGLPIIRTSVDHGTAFGKAGKGKADYTSLFEAIKYAIKMAFYKNEGIKNGYPR